MPLSSPLLLAAAAAAALAAAAAGVAPAGAVSLSSTGGLRRGGSARYFTWRSEEGEDGRGPPARPLPKWLKERTKEPLVKASEAPSVVYAGGGLHLEDEARSLIRANERYLAGEESTEEDESPAAEAAKNEKEKKAEEGSAHEAVKRTAGEMEAKKEIMELAATPHFAKDGYRMFLAKPEPHPHLPANLQHFSNGLPYLGRNRAPDGPGVYHNSIHNYHAVMRGYTQIAAMPPLYGMEAPGYHDIFDEDGEDPASGSADPLKAEPTEQA